MDLDAKVQNNNNNDSGGFLKKIILGGVVVIVVIFVFGVLLAPKKIDSCQCEIDKENNKDVKVDVAGAVKKPGMYTVNANDRVGDVIELAGGFTSEADLEYCNKLLNKAQRVSDGMKIYIPKLGEATSSVTNTQNSTSQMCSIDNWRGLKVNINTASEQELIDLPWIGPVTAKKIIANRPYKSYDDILNKKVMSFSQFEKVKDCLTF